MHETVLGPPRSSSGLLRPVLSPRPARFVESFVGRVHLAVASSLFCLGMVPLLAFPLTSSGIAAAFLWIALGSFPILIFGTSRMLLTGLLGIQLVGPRLFAWLPAGLAGLGMVGYAVAGPVWGSASPALLGLWSLGMLLHVSITGTSVVRHVRRPAGRLAFVGRRLGPAAYPAAAGALYGVVAIFAAPLWGAGRIALPVLVHVHLAGFVVCTIVAASLLLLPRFTGVHPPSWLVWTVALLPLPGPALVAWGVSGHPAILRWGAGIEGAALILFAANVGWQLLRSTRPRASFVPYALAVLSLVTAALLGNAFALRSATRLLVPLHGVLNLVGFVGLFVLGAAWDLYAPTFGRGPDAYRVQGRILGVLATGGLGMFALLYHVAPTLSRLGLGILLLTFSILAIGSWASLARIARSRRMPDSAQPSQGDHA